MLKRFGFSGSSKQDANASRPGKLGQLWAAKHGFQKDGSPAPGAKGENEDQQPRMENIDVGSKEGRIWSDEETNEVLEAFLEIFPQPTEELIPVDIKLVSVALGGLGTPLDHGSEFIQTMCRYLIRHLSAKGDNLVIKNLCGNNGMVARSCCRIVILILSLGGSESLAPVCKSGLPSALVRLMVRMHSMAILVESERQTEEIELRKIHKALGSVVLLLRHVSGEAGTLEDLVQHECVGRLMLLASRAAESRNSKAALLVANSISKWIELHAVDVMLFLVRTGISRLFADHIIKFSILDCLGDALEAALQNDVEPHLLGILGLFKLLQNLASHAAKAGEKDLLDATRSSHPLLLLKSLILRLCDKLYPDSSPKRIDEAGGETPLGAAGAAGMRDAWHNAGDVWETVRQARRRKSFRLMHILGDEVPRDVAYRMLRASKWDIEAAADTHYKAGGGGGKKYSRARMAIGGTGILLGAQDGVFFIRGIIPGSAASGTGDALKLGDEIMAVGRDPVTSTMSMLDVTSLLRGPVGETIELTLRTRTTAAVGEVKTVELKLKAMQSSGSATNPAEELVERLDGALSLDYAAQFVAKAGGDLDRAERMLQNVPRTRTMNDLLQILKEFVFAGEEEVDVDNSVKVLGLVKGSHDSLTRDVRWKDLMGQPGRRVRNTEAFLVMCELWHRIIDDNFREKILDLALEVFTEHPLNFFVLNPSGLMMAALEAQDCLAPNVREKTMKVLEYAITCADAVPEGDLKVLSHLLDSVWEEETAAAALVNVVKWIQFDAKFYLPVFRETGLLSVLVHHVSIFSDLAGSKLKRSSSLVPSSKSGGGGLRESGEDWLAYERNSFVTAEGGTLTAVEGKGAAEFGVALAASDVSLSKGIVGWEWEVAVVKAEGDGQGDAPWCGVGVASKESDLKGVVGGGWFYHSRGCFSAGEMLEEPGVYPFWYDSDGVCTIRVQYTAGGELRFHCNGVALAKGVGGAVGKGMYPAVYCANGWAGGGASFRISHPKRITEVAVEDVSTPVDNIKLQKLGMGEMRSRYIKEALRRYGVWGAELDESASYEGLFRAISNTVDSKAVREELVEMGDDEKRVVFDRIWAAAGIPEGSLFSNDTRQKSEYGWVPISWRVTGGGLKDLVIQALRQGGEMAISSGSEGAGAGEIGELAGEFLYAFARKVSTSLDTPLPSSVVIDSTAAAAVAADRPIGVRCLVTARSIDTCIEALTLLLDGSYENMEQARSAGLRPALLRLLVLPAYAEAAQRLLLRMIANDVFMQDGDLEAILALIDSGDRVAEAGSKERMIFDLGDRARRLHPIVSAHMVRTGWIEAAVECLGRMGVGDAASLGKDGQTPQKSPRKGKQGGVSGISPWDKVRAAAIGPPSTMGPWEKVRCSMAALRLLAKLNASPKSGMASAWSIVGWHSIVENVEAGRVMRLGAGHTIIGMLLEMSLQGSTRVDEIIEKGLGGGKLRGKKSEDVLDEGVEVAHFISQWGDHGGNSNEGGRGRAIECGDAIGLAVCLLTLVKSDLRTRGFNAISQLCAESTANRQILSSCGVASIAVESFAPALASAEGGSIDGGISKLVRDLVASIGVYKLSMRDVGSIVRLGLAPQGSLKVAQALLGDSSPGSSTGLALNCALGAKMAASPASLHSSNLQFPFFECAINGDSDESHILEIPTMALAWTPRSGFSLCMWLKIEPPAVLRGRGASGPSAHLFSLIKLVKDDNLEISLSAAIDNGVVRVWAQAGKMSASFSGKVLEYGRLYHLAIVYQKKMIEPDSVRLYVNGAEVTPEARGADVGSDAKAFLGSIMQTPHRLDVGGSVSLASWCKSGDEEVPVSSTMRLGNVLCVDDLMSHQYIVSHFAAGPAHESQITMDLSKVAPGVTSHTYPLYSDALGEAQLVGLGSWPMPPQSGVYLEDSTKLACTPASICKTPGAFIATGGVPNNANARSIVSVPGSGVDACGDGAMSLRHGVSAFDGAAPHISLQSVGGLGAALLMLERANTPSEVLTSIEHLRWLLDSGARFSSQGTSMSVGRIVGFILRRQIMSMAPVSRAQQNGVNLFESDEIATAILRFTGLSVGDEGAVMCTPHALPDLVLSRWLWKAAPPHAQVRMSSLLTSALANSSHRAFNSKRLELIGGLHAMLHCIMDPTLPDDSVGHLVSMIRSQLVNERKPADLNDLLMCVLTCLTPSSSSGGGGGGGMASSGSGGSGVASEPRRVSIGSEPGSSSAAARLRKVEISNSLLEIIVELQYEAHEGDAPWDEWRIALHKTFGARTLVHLLRMPFLHPRIAIALLQILLLHVNGRQRHMRRFKGVDGLGALKDSIIPLADCPYMFLLTLHLLFGIPVQYLSQSVDQEVLIVLVSEMARNVTAIAFPEAMTLYCLMVEELCKRDGHACTSPPPWEDICRLPAHTDPIASAATVAENVVPHRVAMDQQRALAATAMQLLSLLFETCSTFQAKVLSGDFNEPLLALLLSPGLCAPPLVTKGGGASRSGAASQREGQGSDRDSSSFASPRPSSRAGNEDGIENDGEVGEDGQGEGTNGDGVEAEGGEQAGGSTFEIQGKAPSMEDAGEGESANIGRWHQPAFSVERTEHNEQAKLLKSDTARVVMLHEFVDDNLLERLRTRLEGRREGEHVIEGAIAVPANLVECLDGSMATRVLELLVAGVVEGFTQQTKTGIMKKALTDVPVGTPMPLIAVLQSKIILSVLLWLGKVITDHAIKTNGKLAVNMTELCELAVVRMERGLFFLGERVAINYCMRVVSFLMQDHYHLAKSATASTLRLIQLLIARLPPGPDLSSIIEKVMTHKQLALHVWACESKAVCYIFHHLERIICDGSWPDERSKQLAAELAGTMMAKDMPHTRQHILSLLVQKRSSFFSKEKPIDLFNGGFDKLLAVSSMLSKGKKAGERLPEFEEWLAGADKEGIVTGRLGETFFKLGSEMDQKREQVAKDDLDKIRGKMDAKAAAMSKAAASLKKVAQKRQGWESALEEEVALYKALDLVAWKRDAQLAKVAQLSMLRIRQGGIREWRVLSPSPERPVKWTLDLCVDRRQMRRRLVRMSSRQPIEQAGTIANLQDVVPEVTRDSFKKVAKAIAAILPPKRPQIEDVGDAGTPPGSPPQPAVAQPGSMPPFVPRAQSRVVQEPDSGLPSAAVLQADSKQVTAAGQASTSTDASPEPVPVPVPVPGQSNTKKGGGLFSTMSFGFGRKQGKSVEADAHEDKDKQEVPAPSAGADTASAAETNNLDAPLEHLAGNERASGSDQPGQQQPDAVVVVEEGSRKEDTFDDDFAEEEEETEGALLGEWMQGKSKLDAEWRMAAFFSANESAIKAVRASRVLGVEKISGTIVLCHTKGNSGERPTAIYFIADSEVEALAKEMETDAELERRYAGSCGSAEVPFGHPHQLSPGVFRWRFDEVRIVCGRLYQLQPVALEIVSKNGGTCLVVFENQKSKAQVEGLLAGNVGDRVLEGVKTAGIGNNAVWNVDPGSGAARESAMKQLQKAWASGMMSNLDYLLELNALAGRTVNDLSQYPVMPWVLADYTSESLDLSDPATFRDLSRPMGALDPAAEEAARDRYDEWDEESSGAPPFHYGSHYSTSAHVMHYLVRLEPFTSYQCTLQSGRLDLPDRLFHDIGESYRSASTAENLSDVKELIPEFFYNADFLLNGNGVDMGVRQDEQVVNDVVLPPWAKGDCREFIRLHRAALESEYVSAHLHEWIDLIFGFKQRGKPAEEACNVFYYLTYDGAVDISRLEDGVTKDATIAQIINFGQTPRQLFRRPHPKRGAMFMPKPSVMSHPEFLSTAATVNVGSKVGDLLFTGDRFIAYTSNACPLPTSGDVCLVPHLGRPGSVAVLQTDTRRKFGILESIHDGTVTAMKSSPGGSTLATGGDDGLVCIWDITESAWWAHAMRPLFPPLSGHTSPITCLAMSQAHGVCVSGCAAGEVFVWDSKRGVALYILDGHSGSPLLSVSIDEETGMIATCSDSHVRLWSVSGQLICSISKGQVAGFEVSASAVTLRAGAVFSKTEYLITGHQDGRVRFWSIIAAGKGSMRSMKCHWTLEGTGDEVTALATSVGCRELAIGDRNGKAIVWRPNLDSAPPSSAVATLRQQSSAVDAFCSAVDVLAGGDGDVGREPSASPSSLWITRESALQMLLASGDCSEPYVQGWEQPARGAARNGDQDGDEPGVGVYAALYAFKLRSAASELEVAMGKVGALKQVDAFVTGYRGASFAGFWKELQGCMATNFSLSTDWLDADMAKWTSPAQPS